MGVLSRGGMELALAPEETGSSKEISLGPFSHFSRELELDCVDLSIEVALGVLSRGGMELALAPEETGSSKEITLGALSREALALTGELFSSYFSSFFSSIGLSGITKGSPTRRSTGSLDAVFWASWRANTSSRSLSNVIIDSRESSSLSGRWRARAQSRILLTSTTEKESF